jgi:hypothetical protein
MAYDSEGINVGPAIAILESGFQTLLVLGNGINYFYRRRWLLLKSPLFIPAWRDPGGELFSSRKFPAPVKLWGVTGTGKWLKQVCS